ncbi:5798_t:CDS:1 [Dentiscutata heterogama]|uniref:5798_t:CDS:1 n=1 Tax=Dentiscutata heterogama TaxID=1316150 RepID=A0ACA9MYR0_9GLOM|nr:5798_t:CDS:1 [Dentiscutata heterogama]
MSLKLSNRLNVSCACDSCKDLKIKCDSVATTTSTTKCTQCIRRNRKCTFSIKREKRGPKPKIDQNNKKGKNRGRKPKDQMNHRRTETENNLINETHIDPPKKICDKRNNELFSDLTQEEIKFLSERYTKEQLPQILAILRFTTSNSCPSKNIVDHKCHEGCIIR